MQNKQLKKLTAKWYKKLKDSGFQDIESEDMYGEMRLKQLDSNQLRHTYKSSVQIETTQRYYELARQYYSDSTFDTGREKEVWRLHAEGLSAEIISKHMKSKGYKKNVSVTSIKRITKKLEKLMLAQRVGALEND